MDFRFRAVDGKQPTAPSSSRYSSEHPLQDDSPNAGVMRNWDAQHEFVKQRMKEEIIIREIATRRMLEAEVRRELVIEQEFAMRRVAGRTEGVTFGEQYAMRSLDQILDHFAGQSSRGLLAVPGSSSLNSLPLLRCPEPQREEAKPMNDAKNKLIFLPKPDPEHFEAKRKAETIPPAMVDSGPFAVSLKKAKEEFVCRMCNITATSMVAFNAHLQGKKHRAKEGSGLEAGAVEKRASPEEKGKGSEEDLKNARKAVTEEQVSSQTAESLKKKRCKFWCEMCQVGTQSMAVMETHNKGKKHKARLLKLGKQEEQQEPMSCASTAGREDDTTSIS